MFLRDFFHFVDRQEKDKNRVSLSRPSAFRSFHGNWCSSNLYCRVSLAIRPSSLSSLFSTSFQPFGPGASPFRIWMTAFSVLSKTASGTRKKLKLVGFWYQFLKFVKNSSRGVVRSCLRNCCCSFCLAVRLRCCRPVRSSWRWLRSCLFSCQELPLHARPDSALVAFFLVIKSII